MKEIEKYIQNENDINASVISELTYLDVCVKETLRLMPPTVFTAPKETVKNVKLGDILITKGTLVVADLGSTYLA